MRASNFSSLDLNSFKEAVGKKEILDRKEVLKMAIQSAFQGCTRLLKTLKNALRKNERRQIGIPTCLLYFSNYMDEFRCPKI